MKLTRSVINNLTPQKPKVGQSVEINIDRLNINNGHGVGRFNNFVIFVPYTAPGDLANIELVKVKKTYGIGKLLSLTKPSKVRTEPACPYYKNCGGCQLQHVEYNEQVRQKKLILERFAQKFIVENSTVEFLPSPKKFNYRNRIKVHQFKKHIGFKKNKSDFVVDIKSCLIAEDQINQSLKKMRKENLASNKVRSFEIATQPNGQTLVNEKKSNKHTSTFSQVNTSVNNLLTAEVIKLAEPLDKSTIHDLYSGQGNFTASLKQSFVDSHVVGVELSQTNVRIARQNHPNLKFSITSVEKYLKNTTLNSQDLVIVDPPRTGCADVDFQSLRPVKNLIYISCNLATLERDTHELKKSGYDLHHVKGLDMFPQTGHFESLCLFKART